MESAPGPEVRLPAGIHLPTLLIQAASGCKLVMVHPRGEGISRAVGRCTYPQAQLQASSIVPRTVQEGCNCFGVRIRRSHHRAAHETRLATGRTRAALDRGLFGGLTRRAAKS